MSNRHDLTSYCYLKMGEFAKYQYLKNGFVVLGWLIFHFHQNIEFSNNV